MGMTQAVQAWWIDKARLGPPAWRPTNPPPANLLIGGKPGTGKSYAAKQATYRLARRGGRVAVVSSFGEYNRLAAAFDGSQVVRCGGTLDAAHAEGEGVTLDPCRQERPGRDARERLTLALTMLADGPGMPMDTLAKVVRMAAASDGALGVLEALEQEATSPSTSPAYAEATATLASRIQDCADRRLAPFLFDSGRPPPRLTGPLLVFDLDPLAMASLPARGVEEDRREAFLYLVMSAALDFCDATQAPSVVVVDDTVWLRTRAHEAWDLVRSRARRSRYTSTAVWLVTQRLADLDMDLPHMDSYFPERLLFNPYPPSYENSEVGLFFGTPNPTARQEEAVKALPHRGECLWRRPDGKVRRVSITPEDGTAHDAALI